MESTILKQNKQDSRKQGSKKQKSYQSIQLKEQAELRAKGRNFLRKITAINHELLQLKVQKDIIYSNLNGDQGKLLEDFEDLKKKVNDLLARFYSIKKQAKKDGLLSYPVYERIVRGVTINFTNFYDLLPEGSKLKM